MHCPNDNIVSIPSVIGLLLWVFKIFFYIKNDFCDQKVLHLTEFLTHIVFDPGKTTNK